MNEDPARPAEASGPPELDPFALRIAEANRTRLSWRRRLEWVKEVLEDARVRENTGQLAALAVYLRMLGTGSVACAEDGGHHRPSRHAELALQIERQLLESEPRPNRALVRRILRWLPSHDAPFRRAEPLTRIRDIAHRSDIPGKLKQEIKHTLQNKLHRSAGPEDLVTSARLLERVRQESTYPSGFVQELEVFHAELEEFFNARSLDDELEGLAAMVEGPELELMNDLRRSLAQKDKSRDRLEQELALSLELRTSLGPAFDRVGEAISQHKRIVDIKLEEHAFALLSQRTNALESSEQKPSWEESLGLLGQALHHFALHSSTQEHCEGLVEALDQWLGDGSSPEPEHLLRLVALLQVARWVVNYACSEVLVTLARPAEQLGRALGVAPETVTGLVEGEIRQSLVFQLSRLVELLANKASLAAGVSSWQPVVVGKVQGRFLVVDSLGELPREAGRWILVLGHAAGDESLPSSVVGALVRHDLPVLSHLALRARQAGVVMAAGRQQVPRDLEGQTGWLAVDATRVAFGLDSNEPLSGMPSAPPAKSVRQSVPDVTPIAVDTSPREPLILLGAAELGNAGAKGFASRRLLELCRASDAGFSAPDGWVIPFGVMERCWVDCLGGPGSYRELVQRLDHAEGSSLQECAGRLREFVRSFTLPQELLQALTQALPIPGLYAVRSSSNLEDLATFSAAGLHDSVLGVPSEQVGSAILAVWASLYSERAVSARRAVGVAADATHMAVLIQPLVLADVSFVMFTRSTLHERSDRAYAELAVGLGEVLTSALADGAPLRLEFAKSGNPDPKVLAFPSYPRALRADAKGLTWEAVRYARVPIVASHRTLQEVVRQLALLARTLETALGGPQDIEGALVDGSLHVVQSRPLMAPANLE